MKKMLSLLLACLMLASLCACGNSDRSGGGSRKSNKEKLIGFWERDGVVMTLNKDGTGSISESGISIEFEWEATEYELTIALEIMGEKTENSMEYRITANNLILIDEEGEEEEWARVKDDEEYAGKDAVTKANICVECGAKSEYERNGKHYCRDCYYTCVQCGHVISQLEMDDGWFETSDDGYICRGCFLGYY